MKCSQTGRKIKAKVGDISRKDMSPLTQGDLKKGSSLVVVNGKAYPVECAFVDTTPCNNVSQGIYKLGNDIETLACSFVMDE